MNNIFASLKDMPIDKKLRRIALIWIPILILLALITCLLWLSRGEDLSFALMRGLSVLITGCPLAFFLSATLTIKTANKIADQNGIIYRTDNALEHAGMAQIITLNKTGTITTGTPTVTDVFTADHFSTSGYSIGGLSEDELLETAAILESKNDSPLSKAILKYTNELIIEPEDEVSEYGVFPGKGIEANLNGICIRGGTLEFIMEKAIVSEEIKLRAKELSAVGKMPVFYSKGKRLLGMIAVVDKIKEDAVSTISELKRLGLHVVMFTGNVELTSTIIGSQAGADEILSCTDPEDKADLVKELSKRGRVISFTENYKDTPSMHCADTAVIYETDNITLRDASDVIIVHKSLTNLAGMVRLSRMVLKNIQENVLFSVIYTLVCVFFATGIAYKSNNVIIDPLLAVIFQLLAVVVVLINSSRVKFSDIQNSFNDEYTNNYTKG